MKRTLVLSLLVFFLAAYGGAVEIEETLAYPDQLCSVATGDSLLAAAESITNMTKSADGKSLRLLDNALSGQIVFKPQTALTPFDEGLPSWNGTAPGDSGGFRILIRFPYQSAWSPWLEVGYWKANLWPGSKRTSFAGGQIDIDTALLGYYATQWQFAVEMKRTAATVTSPSLSKLSFFYSDSRTTQNINHAAILSDRPAAIFIPTTFLAQYRISSEIGSRICSPTSVAMILLSYKIKVDPLQFAWDTLDPYYDIFGVWPRVVQNASEYGLDGSVTRYRSWSQAREVLAQGGRIAMSIGLPLYEGHLVMLAGFNQNGDPIVHDPARSGDGYAKLFNKSDLSRSWFDKGGVAYTFFPPASSSAVPALATADRMQPTHLRLYANYPNPFNAATTFTYELTQGGTVQFTICDLTGRTVITLVDHYQSAGTHRLVWDGKNSAGQPAASGFYLYRLIYEGVETETKKLLLVR